MELHCMPCFVKQALQEIEGSNLSIAQKEEATRVAMKVLSDIDMTLPPVGVSLVLHGELMKVGIDPDPYHDLKKTSTEKTLGLIDDLTSTIDGADDRLKTSVLMAIAGNVIDFGAKNQLDLEKTLLNGMEKGLVIDDISLFKKELIEARTLTYYLDNSGEVVLDHLFLQEIIRANPEIKITVYSKRVPLLNDVTVEDTREAGIHDGPNITVLPLPHDGWVSYDDVDILGGDIVVSKGQGNFESLSEKGGIFFLLVIKCEVVGEALGGSVGEMVFKKS